MKKRLLGCTALGLAIAINCFAENTNTNKVETSAKKTKRLSNQWNEKLTDYYIGTGDLKTDEKIAPKGTVTEASNFGKDVRELAQQLIAENSQDINPKATENQKAINAFLNTLNGIKINNSTTNHPPNNTPQ